MLRSYWGVVRQLVLHHIDAPAGFRPHPLMPLVVNLQVRIDACFGQLVNCKGAERAQGSISSLIDIVLSGEPDDLQAVPEWSYEQVGGVDRFIEEARLILGAKSYPMTAAEEMCLQQAQKALDDYEQEVKSSWAKMVKRAETKRDQFSPAQPAASTDSKQQELRAFSGGTMVFFQDRVELCGANICSGPRSRSRRRILDLLRAKLADGNYAAYSGEELAEQVGLKGREPAVAGVIRDLRNEIVDALRGQAKIECARHGIILSGGRGYRLADCISVQDGEPPTEALITDMELKSDVPNVPDRADANVPDVPDVPDDAAAARRAWILLRLADGQQLQAPAIAEQLKCSTKTAQRDLQALKNEGRIEFVGPARTGYYRLKGGPPAG
jgi:biotin operon repressor